MHTHDEQVVLEDAEQYYIVWDEATIPTVAFDTYFVAESTGKTIGIRH